MSSEKVKKINGYLLDLMCETDTYRSKLHESYKIANKYALKECIRCKFSEIRRVHIPQDSRLPQSDHKELYCLVSGDIICRLPQKCPF